MTLAVRPRAELSRQTASSRAHATRAAAATPRLEPPEDVERETGVDTVVEAVRVRSRGSRRRVLCGGVAAGDTSQRSGEQRDRLRVPRSAVADRAGGDNDADDGDGGGEEPRKLRHVYDRSPGAMPGDSPVCGRRICSRAPRGQEVHQLKQYGSARVTRVDAARAISVAGGLYQPVRHELDVRAFGVNAYFAARAGDQLIEKHDESGSGAGRHAELYVVLTGSAAFEVDGVDIDAPAGTLVFVADPAATRAAKAAADGTSCLVVGGPADRELPISPFEYWFRAEKPYADGDYETAVAIVEDGLADWPEHPSMLYQLACYHSLAGDAEAALDCFERACRASPKVREWAARDADLDPIRDHARFVAALAAAGNEE